MGFPSPETQASEATCKRLPHSIGGVLLEATPWAKSTLDGRLVLSFVTCFPPICLEAPPVILLPTQTQRDQETRGVHQLVIAHHAFRNHPNS